MATSDQAEVANRLTAVLPPWFAAGASPVLSAALQGAAWVGAQVHGLIGFARLQTRIATATGGWLDLIAFDFFGRTLIRASGQSDAGLRDHLSRELLRPRGTRPALVAAVIDLTGTTPSIFEPWRPSDCGAYGYGGLGYNDRGGYGSLALPAQCFVTVTRGGGAADADIYLVVAETMPAGVTAWTTLNG
jgi:hypothetical protein